MIKLNNKKAFISIFTIFFITVFLFVISSDKEELSIEDEKLLLQNIYGTKITEDEDE
jgi:hypothetical protein